MNVQAELLTFAGIMVLGQFSPGPDMLLLTRTSLAEGARHGVAMAVGIATGLMIHATLAIGGTAVVFQQEGWLSHSVRYIAALYLLWLSLSLAMEIYRRDVSKAAEIKAPHRSGRSAYLRGLLCNLLNPKVVLFLAAVVAPFLTGPRPDWWPAALWLIIVVQAFALWSLWALCLQWKPVRAGYQKCGVWIDAGFAILLAGLAIRLILS